MGPNLLNHIILNRALLIGSWCFSSQWACFSTPSNTGHSSFCSSCMQCAFRNPTPV